MAMDISTSPVTQLFITKAEGVQMLQLARHLSSLVKRSRFTPFLWIPDRIFAV